MDSSRRGYDAWDEGGDRGRSSSALYMSRVPSDWDEEAIRSLHSDLGADTSSILGIKLLAQRKGTFGGRSAIIKYRSAGDAQEAMDVIKGQPVCSDDGTYNPLVVRFADAHASNNFESSGGGRGGDKWADYSEGSGSKADVTMGMRVSLWRTGRTGTVIGLDNVDSGRPTGLRVHFDDGDEGSRDLDAFVSRDGRELGKVWFVRPRPGLRVRNSKSQKLGTIQEVANAGNSLNVRFDDGMEGWRAASTFEASDGQFLLPSNPDSASGTATSRRHQHQSQSGWWDDDWEEEVGWAAAGTSWDAAASWKESGGKWGGDGGSRRGGGKGDSKTKDAAGKGGNKKGGEKTASEARGKGQGKSKEEDRKGGKKGKGGGKGQEPETEASERGGRGEREGRRRRRGDIDDGETNEAGRGGKGGKAREPREPRERGGRRGDRKERSIVAQALREVAQHLRRPGSEGRVWIPNWPGRYQGQLGHLREFLEQHPEKFKVAFEKGKQRRYKVEFANPEDAKPGAKGFVADKDIGEEGDENEERVLVHMPSVATWFRLLPSKHVSGDEHDDEKDEGPSDGEAEA